MDVLINEFGMPFQFMSCLASDTMPCVSRDSSSNGDAMLAPVGVSNTPQRTSALPVALGHTLQLVLLLDRVRVAATLRCVDQLFRQALRNALDVPESSLTRTDGEKRDSLVHSSEGRHIDGLSAHGTCGTNTCGVFTRAAVDDSVDRDLNGVGVGCDVDLYDRIS